MHNMVESPYDKMLLRRFGPSSVTYYSLVTLSFRDPFIYAAAIRLPCWVLCKIGLTLYHVLWHISDQNHL